MPRVKTITSARVAGTRYPPFLPVDHILIAVANNTGFDIAGKVFPAEFPAKAEAPFVGVAILAVQFGHHHQLLRDDADQHILYFRRAARDLFKADHRPLAHSHVQRSRYQRARRGAFGQQKRVVPRVLDLVFRDARAALDGLRRVVVARVGDEEDVVLAVAGSGDGEAADLVGVAVVTGDGDRAGRVDADDAVAERLSARLAELPPTTTMLRQGLTPAAIAERLLEDFPYRVLGTTELEFACNCSRRQILNLLRALGADELDRLIEEDDGAAVTCEYCKEVYTVTADALRQLRARL